MSYQWWDEWTNWTIISRRGTKYRAIKLFKITNIPVIGSRIHRNRTVLPNTLSRKILGWVKKKMLVKINIGFIRNIESRKIGTTEMLDPKNFDPRKMFLSKIPV